MWKEIKTYYDDEKTQLMECLFINEQNELESVKYHFGNYFGEIRSIVILKNGYHNIFQTWNFDCGTRSLIDTNKNGWLNGVEIRFNY